MARLALKDLSSITVSTMETDRPGPSYTVDTLEAFNEILPPDTALFFLVGVDAFLEIHTWKTFERLFDMTAFVVMSRPKQDGTPLSLTPLVVNYVHRLISEAYKLTSDGQALAHPEKKTIYLSQVTPIPIASSQIRDKVRLGKPIHDWVNPAVSDYIEKKGLYR